MSSVMDNPKKLLLHACCGPCSLEPVRLLRQRGIEAYIYYSNSNIAPAAEYDRRLQTIRDWSALEGLSFTEADYAPELWEEAVGKAWEDQVATADISQAQQGLSQEERCRACYRLRFEESAAWAVENGFDAMGTTLSVSPYQYTQIIREELERACEAAGIRSFFEDYSPYYSEATRRSREAGMYRQKYCGCRFSAAEAAKQQEERAQQKAERAQKRASEQREIDERKAQRAEYDKKRAHQRAILKALREESRHA